VTTGKTITLGVGVGITAYLALVACLTLFGVKIGELGQFPTYVGCLAKLEVQEAEAHKVCRPLRSYFQAEDGDSSNLERLAAKFIAVANRLTATARNDVNEIKAVWITPIVDRLEMAFEVAKDIFAP
jgi:hypothetical protein